MVNEDVYEDKDVNVDEEVIVEDIAVKDVEDKEVLVDTSDANVDGDVGDVQDVNVEVEGVDVDDLLVLKVGDADGN